MQVHYSSLYGTRTSSGTFEYVLSIALDEVYIFFKSFVTLKIIVCFFILQYVKNVFVERYFFSQEFRENKMIFTGNKH